MPDPAIEEFCVGNPLESCPNTVEGDNLCTIQRVLVPSRQVPECHFPGNVFQVYAIDPTGTIASTKAAVGELSWGGTFIQQSLHGSEGFIAHVMLDALGIDVRDIFANADRAEEPEN